MKRYVVAILSFIVMTGAGVALAANWALVDENELSSFYYDKSSVKRPETGKVQVLTRAVYTREGKTDALKVLAHYKDMDRLTESLYLYEFDCLEEQTHLLGVTHLDKEGKTLRSSNLGGVTKWEDIDPGTRIAEVFGELCPQ